MNSLPRHQLAAMTLRVLVLLLLALSCSSAQDFNYSSSALEDDGLLARAMPAIAERSRWLDHPAYGGCLTPDAGRLRRAVRPPPRWCTQRSRHAPGHLVRDPTPGQQCSRRSHRGTRTRWPEIGRAHV